MIKQIKKVGEAVWEIPTSYKQGMLVPARIYGTENILKNMDDGVFDQVTNVACLPGIQKYSYCMPDGHWGYGFPIGGVAAFDLDEGVISPGGIGFDINCGMRLVTTNLTYKDVKPKLKELIDTFFRTVPAGVGAKGILKLNDNDLKEIMVDGAQWCIEKGYGWDKDKQSMEEFGRIKDADPEKVSQKAISRGIKQVGTLGSGNHYLEVQMVKAENIFEPEIAKQFGIIDNEQIVVMVHCGSRGFGHQIATDYLRTFDDVMKRDKIEVKDRQLACAPFNSKEGQDYYKAMACAANMAFANRQTILHRIREGFSKVFNQDAENLDLNLVYDVAHNIAKVEKHKVDNKMKKVLVHRKGSTRSFGPGHEELAERFQKTGQPVILGGSMETGSYLLVGTKKAEEETFGSTAHGSGRTMSRTQARRTFRGDKLQKDMEARGIYVKAVSMKGLAEEAGDAYKNISEVVDAIEKAGITKKVVALKPIGNVKG
ncbi:RtcB family protein [Candidatus Woesearchaeota archaeon]|nr:RtcB family protein [Candidatus Woesearchaeota archaeon]